MANLEYFAGQFLEYHDEADVLPETEQPINLEELITDERRGPPVDTFYIFPRIFCVFDSPFIEEQYKKNRGVLA